MASFEAILEVGGARFRLSSCTYATTQTTDSRGRVKTRVQHSLVELGLDVPESDFLLAWASSPHKQEAVSIVFLDATSASALETLRLKAAYCVSYEEAFAQGDTRTGAYQCRLTLADPSGFTLTAGGPSPAFVAPAARDYAPSLAPAVGAATALAGPATALAARTLGGPGVVPPHLPAPQPNPSPDHKQVHLSQAEWQDLTKGRWDRRHNKKFLKAQCQTEFHVAGDPCTYRVDAAGKMEAVYDAQKSYNIIGTRKGYPHIPLTCTGQPTYAGTKHMYPPGPPHETVVVIEMAGNRNSDFLRANTEARLLGVVQAQGLKNNKAPKGYTWHHRDDFTPNVSPPPLGTCTMELVTKRAHRRTFVHVGACDQCNKHFGKTLYK